MSVFFENNGHQIKVTVSLPDGSAVTAGTITAFIKDRRGNAIGSDTGYPLSHAGGGVWTLSLDIIPMVAGGRYELTITIGVTGIPAQRIDMVIPCRKRSA